MPFFRYSGRWFNINAEEVYDEQGQLCGFQPVCNSMLQVPLEQADGTTDMSVSGWIPGPPVSSRDEALQKAMSFVRLNWPNRGTRRVPSVGDRVGHIPSNRIGVVLPPHSGGWVNAGRVLVKFDQDGQEEVSTAALVCVPRER